MASRLTGYNIVCLFVFPGPGRGILIIKWKTLRYHGNSNFIYPGGAVVTFFWGGALACQRYTRRPMYCFDDAPFQAPSAPQRPYFLLPN